MWSRKAAGVGNLDWLTWQGAVPLPQEVGMGNRRSHGGSGVSAALGLRCAVKKAAGGT
jgi:hypothetical protein